MPEAKTAFFPSVTHQLIERASRAYLSHLSPTSHTLRSWLSETLSRPPGQPDALLADPVFEAMWSWRPAEPTMAELAGTLLHPKLVRALDQAPEDTRFAAAWQPFAHQLRAWQSLRGEPRSLVVSSGTGSGKTECFLIPILDRLVREAEAQVQPLVGVRALFLYPLNALIASQRERLSSWLAPFDGKIRYALYNADLPRRPPANRGRLAHEVDNRVDLWASPPPILVTNSTMLEYMLVRDDDGPLLDKSQGKLEWIVLDEAHTYVGSQAAETALLLRRVLSAFGCTADQVRFIATSATIGGSEDSRVALRRYLASIAGVDPSRVEVVIGERAKPELPASPVLRDVALDDVVGELDALPAERRYDACMTIRPIRRVIESLREREAKLSELVVAAGSDPQDSPEAGTRVLELLDRVREVRDPQGRALLPLRGHLFQRTIAGVWACVNRNCQPDLDEDDWVFGRIYFARRESCDCGAPVYPLVLCRNCGAEYLAAEGSSPADMRPRAFELDDQDDDDGDDDEGGGEGQAAKLLLICGHEHKPPRRFADSEGVKLDTAAIEWQGARTQVRYRSTADGVGLRCVQCGEQDHKGRRLFRPMMVGAPFMLGTSIPVLLEHAPKATQLGATPLPAEGRRTITFTDSRQGTGYFALKARAEAERNFVRGTIWAALRPTPPSRAQLDRWAALERERADLQASLSTLPEVVRRVMLDKLLSIDTELAARDQPRGLDWSGARLALLGSANLKPWALADWQDYLEDPATLAQFFLYREFARRPARASSLESLGLVAIRYPALATLREHEVPASALRLGITRADWIDYLTLLLDYLVRSNVATRVTERFGDDVDLRYPFDYLRWMGTRIRFRAVTSPDYVHQGPRNDYLRAWPRGGGRPPRLISLLNLGLGDGCSNAEVNELMHDAWATLEQRGLLIRVSHWAGRSESAISRERALGTFDHGYVLPLDKQVELVPVERAYLCPITRRMLPVTFRGLSPYIDKADAPIACEEFTMPRPPADPRELADWLEHEPTIVGLRERGVWTENSDRIVSGALYFRVVEHSANVDGPQLRRREQEFRRGEINLLSCSTTMEMGVDIGGISSVAMNNAPPAPANYLQRAGRAGRRGETAALSLTLCGAVPHGEAVFREPRWPFATPIRVPRVSLESTRIVQRHVNAICLREFLLRSGRANRMKLTMGWFFGRPEQSGVSEVWRQFTRRLESSSIPELDVALGQLVAGSMLSGLDPRSLRQSVIQAIEQVVEPWVNQRDALEAELEQAGGQFAKVQDASLAQLAISRQLRRLLGEYLLRELASRGFLPGHGFPTQVVPLVNTTFEDLERAKRRKERTSLGEASDEVRMDPEYPSRDLAVAIREYAPGNAVVIDGRIYESSGVTLNWKVPAGRGDDQKAELQSFRFAWSCEVCDIQDTDAIRRLTCPSCGGAVKPKPYMQPAGFAVRLDYRTHNDLSRRSFVTTCKPWISAGASWQPLPSPAYGRMRSSSSGMIFHSSRGLSRLGYALCVRCGFAASEYDGPRGGRPGTLPRAMDEHPRLRGRRSEGERVCPGVLHNSIRRYLSFGGQLETDVFELQLRDPGSGTVLDETLATTLAVALRRALAELVGVEDREIGWDAKMTNYEAGLRGHSIALYDTASGGAGFVTQARDRMHELLVRVSEILACPRECQRACHGCLLTYDTQGAIEFIDRRKAAAFVSDSFLAGFELPSSLRLLGPATKVEYDALHGAIERERSLRGGTQLRVYLGGAADQWEPSEWALRRMLEGWAAHMDLRVIASPGVLAALPDPASRSLAALIDSLPRLRLHTCDTPPLHTIVELETREGVVRWASTSPLVPGPSAADSTYLIAESAGERLGSLDLPEIAASTIRPSTPDGLETVDVLAHLDGPIAQFEAKIWALILPAAQQLALKLQSGARIREITYSDRYVVTPLVTRLVVDLLHGFVELAAANVGSETVVSVLCIAYDRKGGRRRDLHKDWEYCTTRDQVVKELLERRLGGRVGACETSTGDRGEIAHARGLFVRFVDGTQWKLRLDEGLGFMQADDSHVFPFEATVDDQVAALAGLAVAIRKRYRYSSPMFVGQTVR